MEGWQPVTEDSVPSITGIDTDSLVGVVLGGRYAVTGKLGKGGAGHVYKAIQQPLGREVAVKVLRSDLAPLAAEEFSARFLREAEAISVLRHPNVVTVFDFGVDADLQFVVMEWLKGDRLSDRIAQGPMSGRDVTVIGAGIARGLRHAHGKGLVHRDVKPSNVILEPGDDGERPVLLDFGLVKPSDEDEEVGLTKVGTYMGTPSYMAPEQARGDGSVDARTDIYALGCVMFKMLTGKAPYSGKSALALALAHTSEPVPKMMDRNPKVYVDPVLEAIVLRCIQKRPADRWPDAAALAAALEGWEPAPEVAPARDRGSILPWVVAGLGIAATGLAALGLGGAAVLLNAGTGGDVPVEPHDAVISAPVDIAPVPEAVPEPAPEPEPARPPEPAPAVAPEPRPEPVAAPAPKPAPAARPAPAPRPSGPDVVADGVYFDAAHAARALEWLNTADEPTLRAGGMLGRQVNIVLGQRPFASLEVFADTPYIGQSTLESVHRSTKE